MSARDFYIKISFSLLTIFACLVMIVSSALAFFYTDVKTNDTTLKSAWYSITLDNAENNVYVTSLAPNDTHRFEIRAGGTASTGYCKVTVGEDTYFTEQIKPGESVSLTVIAAKGTVITFEPFWGVNPSKRMISEVVEHSRTPFASYKVEVLAKLEDIAFYYGVSEKDILMFNDLNGISVGDALKIPGVDPATKPYSVPYAEYKMEPTATLAAISEHYKVSVAYIRAFNGLTEDSELSVGSLLKIPGADKDTTPYSVPYASYKVEPTAYLSDIALYYGVSESDILTYNGIDRISINTVLKIPGVDKNKTPYAVECALLKVVDGATLEGIALHYGVKTSDILIYNNITALTVDTVIKIPGVPSDTKAYVAPDPDPLNNSYYRIMTQNKIKSENADLLVYYAKKYDKSKDLLAFNLECDKEGQYFFDVKNKVKTISLCFAITKNIEQGYLKIVIGESEYYSVPITKDSYVRLDIAAAIGTKIRIEAHEGTIDPELGITVFYGDDLKNDIYEKYMKLDHVTLSAKTGKS